MSAHTTLTTLRCRLLGVAFIVVIAMLLTLSVAIYNNAFTKSVTITLRTDHVGNQLLAESDVKVRGLVVGEVRGISSRGEGAELKLALDPETVNQIPSNVSARLLPKTLFGERYVSLVVPNQPSGEHLLAGDVIDQDRSSTAIELERVLGDLMPVLQAVQPQKLATTLNSLATALDGRGKPLGDSLVLLDRYLDELNTALPELKDDISALAKVADTYHQAAPDLLLALADLTVTSKTIAEQRANLEQLYGGLTTASGDLTNFLQANQNNIIRLGDSSRPTLELLAKYAPEYPCVLSSLASFQERIDKAFGKGTNEPGMHVTVEVVSNRGKYVPRQDGPSYADKRGPRCYDISPRPAPFPQYPQDGPIKDGSRPGPPPRTAGDGLNPPANAIEADQIAPASSTVPNSDGSNSDTRVDPLGLANSPPEQRFITALMARSHGIPVEQVPDWSSLLIGPLLRGAEVTVR